MGVRNLWQVIEPTAHSVKLESLRGKILAIDASIWIYHFIKAMRDREGNVLRAAHIVGFFRRICKLMFFEIRPVFVFDGAVPVLKKRVTSLRNSRRQGRAMNAQATANKLLTLQMQRIAQEKSGKVGEKSSNASEEAPGNKLKSDRFSNASGASRKMQFYQKDQYHLPEIEGFAPIRVDDQRLLTDEELNEYAEEFTKQARLGFIDFTGIDFKSEDFDKLPMATRYQLLNTARLKSRLRMGYTAEQLNRMFADRMEFSRFQIERVAQRNFFTQKLMNLVGLEEDLTISRVSGEKNKEYMLCRNDQGWTLSLEERTTKQGHASEAPDLKIKNEDLESSSGSDSELLEEIPLRVSADAEGNAKPDVMESANHHQDTPLEDTDHGATTDYSNDDLLRIAFGFEAEIQRKNFYKSLAKANEGDKPDFCEKQPQHTVALPRPSEVPTLEQQSKTLRQKSDAAKLSQEPKFKDNGESSENAELPPWFSREEERRFAPMEVQTEQPGNLMPKSKLQFSEYDRFDFEEQRPSTLAGHSEKTSDISVADVLPETELAGSNAGSNAEVEGSRADTAQSRKHNYRTVADIQINERPTENVDPESKGEVLQIVPNLESDLFGDDESVAPENIGLSEQPVLSGKDLERAVEDYKAEEEEDDQLAQMLIEEAEENERFAKNVLTLPTINPDIADFDAEVKLLKNQFAKENRDAANVTDEMIQDCVELLQLFGIPYITAPTEAESQCAELFELKLVDGVVTDDSDCFLFGDVRVYRNMFSRSKFIEMYSSKDIATELGLDRERLIDLACMLGSDYTDGIVGIGPVTSVEILAEFGSLACFKEWWNDVQRYGDEEKLNTALKRRLYKQFKSKLFLEDNFPDPVVRETYLHPVVDDDTTPFQWASPNVESLREFLSLHTGWNFDKINSALKPVLEKRKREELLMRTSRTQTTLDDYNFIEKSHSRSKRAADATSRMGKRRRATSKPALDQIT